MDIPLSVVRENYAAMPDEALVEFAHQEGVFLTVDALAVLKEEFARRRLDETIIRDIETDRSAQYRQGIQEAKNISNTAVAEALIQYALDEKRAGMSDDAIVEGLTHEGMTKDDARELVAGIAPIAQARLTHCNNQKLRSGLIFAIGLVVTIFTYANAGQTGYYIVTWGAIVFGGYRFFKAMGEAEKYESILSNIATENMGAVVNEE